MRPARIALIVLATLLAMYVLWQVHAAIVLLVASLAIAAAVNLVADRLGAMGPRRVPRWAALAFAYLAGLALAGVLVWIVGRALVIDAPREADRFAAFYDSLKERAASLHGIVRALVDHLPASRDVFRAVGGGQSQALALAALDASRSLLDGTLFAILSLVLSVYWSGRGTDVTKLVGALIGPEESDTLFGHWRALGKMVGARVQRALFESAVAAVALALVLWWLGVPSWALPSAAVALALLIPFVGPALAVVIGVLAGLPVSVGVSIAGGVSALVIVVLLRKVIAPRLLPVRPSHGLILVATAMILASALGVVGVLLAPLAAEVLTALARRLLAARVAARATRSHLAALAKSVEQLGSAATTSEEVVHEDVHKLVDRLRQLVVEGETSLAAQPVSNAPPRLTASGVR